MLGLAENKVVWLAFLASWYTHVYHANLRTNYGPLKHILVTPQSHRIHHSIEPRHQNKNFGVLFTVWDRFFGTLYTNYEEYPETGVDEAQFPLERRSSPLALVHTYVAQWCYPFRLLARDVAQWMRGSLA